MKEEIHKAMAKVLSSKVPQEKYFEKFCDTLDSQIGELDLDYGDLFEEALIDFKLI